MTPIYLHEYTITTWERNPMGIQAVVITIVSEKEEREDFNATQLMEKFLETNLNVAHKILMTGYRQ